MSRRTRNLLLACAALVLGGMLYVCFRSTTYVAVLFRKIPVVLALCSYIQPYGNEVLAFYLPDLLWAFSFSAMLNAVHDPGMKGRMICAGAAFMAGTVWEVLQYLQLVSGTGDGLDIVAYFLAAVLSIITNLGGKS